MEASNSLRTDSDAVGKAASIDLESLRKVVMFVCVESGLGDSDFNFNCDSDSVSDESEASSSRSIF